jgi:DNA-binding GntR family transcriptional regulator
MARVASGGSVRDLHITRSSAVDQVAEAVREMILRGDLAPGTRLREVQLAESIGISRNTARDAVRALARQGLVTRAMHRGAVVVRLAEDDVVDVFRVRRAIEPQATEASAGATADQLSALEEPVTQLERAAADGDWDHMVEADCLFHLRLVGFLDSPRLDHFYDTIQGELRLCLAIGDRDEGDPDDLVAEHRELYELIATGEQGQCVARLNERLADTEQRLRQIARRLDALQDGDR